VATTFGWCVSLDGTNAELEWVPVEDETGIGISRSRAAAMMVTAGGKTRVLVVNPDSRALCVVPTDAEGWETQAIFDVQHRATGGD